MPSFFCVCLLFKWLKTTNFSCLTVEESEWCTSVVLPQSLPKLQAAFWLGPLSSEGLTGAGESASSVVLIIIPQVQN